MTLTNREYQVLVLSSEGDSKQVVAEILGITESTVRGYVRSMFLKLGARNMAHAVCLGHEQGILTTGILAALRVEFAQLQVERDRLYTVTTKR